MVSVDLCPMLNTRAIVSFSPSESKYPVTSSPSEAVSASIHLIHSRSCICTRKRGGGTIEASLTSVIILHDIVAIYSGVFGGGGVHVGSYAPSPSTIAPHFLDKCLLSPYVTV